MWSTKFPQEEGFYWFYGYRFKEENKPELMLVKVWKCANGFMHVADGHFMHKSEVEEPHFLKVILPELPNLKGTKL